MAGDANPKTFAAMIVAPIIASIAWTGTIVGTMWLSDNGSGNNYFETWFLASLVSTIVATATTIFLGLPIHALLHRAQLFSIWFYSLAGFLGGVAAGLILSSNELADFSLSGLNQVLRWYIFTIPIGTITALFAWLIRRPDRDAPRVEASSGRGD